MIQNRNILYKLSCKQFATLRAVFTFGEGNEGQLGHAKFKKETIITKIPFFNMAISQTEPSYIQVTPRRLIKSRKFNSIAIGDLFTLALSDDGKIYGFGLNYSPNKSSFEPVEIENDNNVKFTSISAGHNFAAAIDSDGLVYTWGKGISDATYFEKHGGHLGHGNLDDQMKPLVVESFRNYGTKAKSLSCGKSHTLILTDDGEVLACGANKNGLLGVATESDLLEPTSITDELVNEVIVQIAAGSDHSLVLTNNGQIFSWGNAQDGQLGHGDMIIDGATSLESLPRLVESENFNNAKIQQIAAGRQRSAAITTDGKLYVWGGSNLGYSPQIIDPLNFNNLNVIKVAIGGGATNECIGVITEDNKLWTLGRETSHILGYESDSTWNSIPTEVTFYNKSGILNNVKVLDIFAGPGQHMAVIAEIDSESVQSNS